MCNSMFPSHVLLQLMRQQNYNYLDSNNLRHNPCINSSDIYDYNNFEHPYPQELLQLMCFEMPPIRNRGYVHPQGSRAPWRERGSLHLPGSPIMPPPSHFAFRPVCNTSMKRNFWNFNKNISRPPRCMVRDPILSETTYNSDSGFSSRSPTPSKQHITSENGMTDDSSEDSLQSSSTDPNIRVKSPVLYCGNQFYQGHCSRQTGPQYYSNHIPRSHSPIMNGTNFELKRRYPSHSSPPVVHRGRRLVPIHATETGLCIGPEHFLTRSHLVQVIETPNILTNGGEWDKLSEGIWNKFLVNQQTEGTFKKKMNFWKHISVMIKNVFPHYGLYLVGSTMNGFGRDSSDMDMCLVVRPAEMDQRNEAIGHLEHLLKYFKRFDFIDKLELIQAKVPILKFRDSQHGLEVDLNCNNAVGIRNTHLLYCYSQVDWRVRPLVLVVKLWALKHKINNAKNMTISSYSLVLMVIHFLQCGVSPPVLPCLHALYQNKFQPHSDIHTINIHEELHPNFVKSNKQTLGELLVEFLYYYDEFDFNQYAISVRTGNKILIDECRRARSYKNDPHQWKYLCIEEPFDLTNTARSVYDYSVFEMVKKVFHQSFLNLRRTRDIENIFELGAND